MRFGANPKTIFEEMAMRSRKCLNVDGKPRGLLAHEDHMKRGRLSVDPRMRKEGAFGSILAKDIASKTPQAPKGHRNSASVMIGDKFRKEDVGFAGRYSTNKKGRHEKTLQAGHIDVHHNREIMQRQQKLFQQ